METTFTSVFVRFYIKQIAQSTPLLQYQNSDTQNPIQDPQIKRKFVIGNKVFSKVEIMGLIVMRQVKDNRMNLVIDDSTGVIEAYIWTNSKNNNTSYTDNDSKIKNSTFVIIKGVFDLYGDKRYIEIDSINVVNEMTKEIQFHMLLYSAQNKINSFNLKERISSNQNKKTIDNMSQQYQLYKKHFTNKLLAFFQLYNFPEEFLDEDKKYINISIEDLVLIDNFYELTLDFVTNNNIDDVDIFLKDCFCTLQERNYLQAKSDFLTQNSEDNYSFLKNSSIIVKISDQEIENFIISMIYNLPKDSSGLALNEILESIFQSFNGYYTVEYIKVLLKDLCERNLLLEVSQNHYLIFNDVIIA